MAERPPDLTGVYGHAWQIHPVARTPDQTAVLATYMLHVPHASPAWTRYMICVIHLREIIGALQPVHRDYPKAQYELMVVALDPSKNPTPDDDDSIGILVPINVRVQFDCKSDDVWAATIAQLATQAVLNGILPIEPDGDLGRGLWTEAIQSTALHKDHHQKG